LLPIFRASILREEADQLGAHLRSGSNPEPVAAVSRANEHFVAGVDDGRRRDRHRCGSWNRYSRAAGIWRELTSATLLD
jgi:hypothetical protein